MICGLFCSKERTSVKDMSDNEKKYLNFGKKVAYGCGDMGSNFMYTLVNSFGMLYLTNAIGLNSGIIGTLMMVSKLLDGFTDLFFGSIIDRTKTKMGKARPWVLWSMIPLAICEVLLFSIPDTGKTAQYAYFFVVYTLLNAVCYTANNIAYSTMSAVITRNGNERVQLGSFRFIMAMISSVLISIYTVILVEHFGNDAVAWRKVAFIYAVMLVILQVICVVFSKEVEYEENEKVQETASKGQKNSVFKDFKLLLTNKFYVRILLYYFFWYFGSGVTGGVTAYYVIYVLDNSKFFGVLSASSQIPVMLCLMIVPTLTKKFSVYKTNLAGRFLGLITTIFIAIAGYKGSFIGLTIFTIARGFLSSPMTGTLNSVIADAAEYTYLKDHRRIEGTLFSCSSIGVKVGTGLGTAACGWLLALGGYDGMAEVQSASALSMISVMFLIIPIIIQVIQLILAAGLNVKAANENLQNRQKEVEV